MIEEQSVPVSVYPNPTSDFLNIVATGKVSIFDIKGRVLFAEFVNGRTVVDVQKWASGKYLVKTDFAEYSWMKSSVSVK
jgi:hypothetical protein